MTAPPGRPCRLVVCRGCCCGTRKKRPGVDHEGQLERLGGLRDAAGGEIPVRTSTCLGPCFQANVVVVQPSAEGRQAGGRPVWLGDFTEDRLIDDLGEWIRDGGPGAAPLPESLAERVTSKDAKKPKKAKKNKKNKKEKKAKKRDKQAAKPEKPTKGEAPVKVAKSAKSEKPEKDGKPEKKGKKNKKKDKKQKKKQR